jgi:hypothetical protein
MSNFRAFYRRPRFLGILDVIVGGLAILIGYAVASGIHSSSLGSSFSGLLESVLVIMPAIVLGVLLVMGIVLEVSAGASFASSDTVNWLPVKASEYVAASAFSLLAYYSVFPVAIISATLPFSIVYGLQGAWALATFLSIFSIGISASVLEIMRAVLNRFSSSFYRRGGQAALAVRAIGGVIAIIAFQSIFYPTVYEHFLGVVTANVGPTWFVPILWASVSVIAFASGNFGVSVLFAILAVGLSLGLFYGAVAARTRYWVPMPPSIRISTAAYKPRRRIGILDTKQWALATKDLRGLIRRREMLRILALPGSFLIISFLTGASGGFSFSIFFGVFIVAFSTLFVGMTSVGAEGRSILNLYLAPLRAKDFVLGKSIPPIIYGSIFGVLFYVISALISRSTVSLAPFLVLASIGLAFEMAFLGIFLGVKFPNFSESPRAAFISQTGGLLAFPLAVLIGGVSIGPLLFTLFFGMGFSTILVSFVISLFIVAIASMIFYVMAVGSSKKLLSEVPY